MKTKQRFAEQAKYTASEPKQIDDLFIHLELQRASYGLSAQVFADILKTKR